ncbi:MAG: hypothetical protein PHP82_02060 [Candidatus ainarchaeum sp.]|nr:hypothetical protein [Candidatus ainarchaeum sp.]
MIKKILMLLIVIFITSLAFASCTTETIDDYNKSVLNCQDRQADCHKDLFLSGIDLTTYCFEHGLSKNALYFIQRSKDQANIIGEHITPLLNYGTYWDTIIAIDTNKYNITKKIELENSLIKSYDYNYLSTWHNQHLNSIMDLYNDHFTFAKEISCNGNNQCVKSSIFQISSNLTDEDYDLAEKHAEKAVNYLLEANTYKKIDSTQISIYYFKIFEYKQRNKLNNASKTISSIIITTLLNENVILILIYLPILFLIILIIINLLENKYHRIKKFKITDSLTTNFSLWQSSIKNKIINPDFLNELQKSHFKYIFEGWVAITIGFSLIFSYVGLILGAVSTNNIASTINLINYLKSYPLFEISHIFLLMWGLITFALFMSGIIKLIKKSLTQQIIKRISSLYYIVLAIYCLKYFSIILIMVFLLYSLTLFSIDLFAIILLIIISIPVIILFSIEISIIIKLAYLIPAFLIKLLEKIKITINLILNIIKKMKK